MNYIIDYLTITIKPDKKSDHTYFIGFNELLGFLKLDNIFDNFTDLGAKRFYQHCYKYNNISVYVSDNIHYENMGFCVEMTGQGCRYFEKIHGRNCWKFFFHALRYYVRMGCKVNISRIDFAFDDKIYNNENRNKLLDLEIIEKCADNHLFTSLYRKCDKQQHNEFKMISSIHETLSKNIKSKTIYFGSKKSNSFCRFYDKLVEQKQKNKNNLLEFQELENICHWVRFEIVFKNSVAIKIISAMLELEDIEFQKKFAEIINYYISFINSDNDNRYKCTMCDWWVKFLGTVEKAKLTCQKLSKNVFARSISWLAQSVAPTLQALRTSVGAVALFKMIRDFGNQTRWKQKHFEIAQSNCIQEQAISNEMYWQSLIPFFCQEVQHDSNSDIR